MAKKDIGLVTRWSWLPVAGVVGALMFIRIVTAINHYRQRTKGAAKIAKSDTTRSAAGGVSEALFAAYQNVWHLTTWPVYFYRMDVNEAFWTAAYTGIFLALSFYRTTSMKGWANQTGYMSYAQLPLVIGLVGKNNIISYLTGVSYEKLNFLHRVSGRVALLTAWLHTGAWCVLGLGKKHSLDHDWMRWGVVATVAYTLLFFGSLRPLRNLAYEFFLVSHFLLAFFYMLGCWLHWDKASYWIYPGFILWGVDRLARYARYIFLNKMWLMFSPSAYKQLSNTSVELLGTDTLRITLDRPGMSWSAAQHCYIVVPSVTRSPLEAHPFTFAGMPAKDGKVYLIAKARDGFTKRLLNAVDSTRSSTVSAYIEGPYGSSHSMLHNDTVVLVVGGAGVTYAAGHLADIIQQGRLGKSAVRKVVLVWMMRSADAVEWMEPVWSHDLANMPPSLSLEAHLHLTKGALVDEDVEKMPYIDGSGTGSSGNSSTDLSGSEEATEKNAEKRGTSFTKASCLAPFATWHVGRADLEEVLSSSAKEAAGPIAVGVCGPSALSDSARDATRKANKIRAVLDGQAAISYHSESFGW